MIGPLIGEALRAMAANRMRSALTMLGMVIGVGAVIMMLAIGKGVEDSVRASIASMGSNLFMVVSGVVWVGRPAPPVCSTDCQNTRCVR